MKPTATFARMRPLTILVLSFVTLGTMWACKRNEDEPTVAEAPTVAGGPVTTFGPPEFNVRTAWCGYVEPRSLRDGHAPIRVAYPRGNPVVVVPAAASWVCWTVRATRVPYAELSVYEPRPPIDTDDLHMVEELENHLPSSALERVSGGAVAIFFDPDWVAQIARVSQELSIGASARNVSRACGQLAGLRVDPQATRDEVLRMAREYVSGSAPLEGIERESGRQLEQNLSAIARTCGWVEPPDDG